MAKSAPPRPQISPSFRLLDTKFMSGLAAAVVAGIVAILTSSGASVSKAAPPKLDLGPTACELDSTFRCRLDPPIDPAPGQTVFVAPPGELAFAQGGNVLVIGPFTGCEAEREVVHLLYSTSDHDGAIPVASLDPELTVTLEVEPQC